MTDVIDSFPARDHLTVLDGGDIPDTPREAAFDDIVALALRLFRVPVALVSLAGENRCWLKGGRGQGLSEIAAHAAVCAHVAEGPGVFVVPDLAADPRFADQPFVLGEPGLRFYAAARAETSRGQMLGAIGIMDVEPRPEGLSPEDMAMLQVLARQVSSQLEFRLALSERDHAMARERASGQRHALVVDAASDAVWDWDLETDRMQWSDGLREFHGYAADEIGRDRKWWLDRIHPRDRDRILASLRAALAGTDPRWTEEYRFRHAGGGYADILVRGSLIRDGEGRATRLIGAILDLTERNRSSARRSAMAELGERLRGLDDPDAMTFAAAEIMGATLQIDRAGYARIDQEEVIWIEHDWLSAGGRSYPGRLRLADFGSFVDDLKRGETVVIADTTLDSRATGHVEHLDAVDVRALVNVPVIEGGRLVALFYLNHGGPRPWSEGDLSFVSNVTNATQAAVGRARSVAALRTSEELFRVFAQAMPNQVWAADAEGRIDWLNQQVDDYFGSPAERGPGATWAYFFHPEDVERARAAWRDVVASGEVYEMEFRLRRRDGAYRWFLARALPIRGEDGRIVRWIGTNTDVHERKLIAAELAEANLLLSSRVEERTRERDRLWSTTNDLMGTAAPDGSVTSINPAWTRMLGWGQSELLARPALELVDPEDRGQAGAIIERLAAGQPVEGLVNRLMAKDGSTRTVMWNAVPDRGVVYFVGRDITDQRRAEEQLRQAHKMEAVGQLTGGIAHDFNNLLTGIIGSLDLLQTRLRQGRTENLDRYLNAATTSAKRAAALTHRLLAFARRQPLDPRPVDAAALVTSLEDLLRRTIGETIGLRIVIEPGLWPILCDANQLESAILNLAINARDAMPDGGELTIAASNTFVDSGSTLLEGGIEPGCFVRLGVRDTGIGMPPDVAERAFDPFFTTKPLGQGTGLGLSMVYGFARQSEGQTTISSEPGRGTEVSIFLPRYRGDLAVPSTVDSALASPAGARAETVLVVEDDLIVRDLVIEVLTEIGLRVLQAVDGPSGLKVLDGEERIDLLVSDVGLPSMNGRQMAQLARRKRPRLPVLFITGYAEDAALSGFLEPGMEMLTKPFSVESLVMRTRAMLDG